MAGRQFGVFWDDFRRVELFPAFGIDPDSTLERIRASRAHDHRSIFEGIGLEYGARMNKQRWGEKTPKHELYLDVLFRWFPDARVIYMLREPERLIRDICGFLGESFDPAIIEHIAGEEMDRRGYAREGGLMPPASSRSQPFSLMRIRFAYTLWDHTMSATCCVEVWG